LALAFCPEGVVQKSKRERKRKGKEKEKRDERKWAGQGYGSYLCSS
jgi:hypothetical protein